MRLPIAGRVRAVLPRIALCLILGACQTDTQTAGLDPAPPEAPPVMALSVAEADFTAMTHGVAPMRTVAISNAGGGALGGLGIGAIAYSGEDTGWLTASLSATTAPATLTLQAAAGNLAPGTYYAAVSLVATGAANSPRSIAVSFRVDAVALGPIIGLSAVSASLSATAGSTGTTQQVLVLPASDAVLTGLAISDVTYDPSASGWLQASLQETSAPTVLLLTPDARDLGVGTYVAIVTISAPGAINSPRTIRVVLNVTPAPVPPLLRLSTTAVAVSGSTASPPATQTVAITNAGGGTIDGLTAGPVNYGPGASGWLNTALSSGTAPAIVTLTPSVVGLSPGTYGATIPIGTTSAGVTPQSVSVTLTVVAAPVPPAIAVAPASLSFAGTAGAGSPPAKTAAITNGGGGILSGLSISAVSYSGAGGWLSASLNSTTAPATLTLTPQTGGLAVGSYSASLQILSPVAANSPQTVTVSLTLAAVPIPPAIGLASSSVSFAAPVGGAAPAPAAIAVSNAGGGTLTGLAAGPVGYGAGGTGWLSAALAPATAPATLTLSAQPGSLAAGIYTATVPVSSPGASNSPQNVTVTFTVTAVPIAPAIALSPSSLSFSATAGSGSPAAKVATVSNAGGGTLSGLAVGGVSYGAGATGWLAASLNTTTAPATLTVTPTLGALTAGTYTATVSVTAAGASNSPQSVSVTFTVAAAPVPPAIVLSPGSLSFSATAGGSSPTAKTSSVTNGGGGTLSGLAVGAITYGAGATGWLAASVNAATAPATLTVTPTLGALPAGSYSATVPVAATGASNSPQNVSVTFTVASGVTQVSFRTDIYPTFQANCLSSGCHVPGQQRPDLSSLTAAYTNLVSATTKYVTPGDSTTGLLLGVLQNTTGPLMPPTGRLSSAFITKVKTWIAQGARNN